jgi:dolichyl-phosphate-mannose--protein O-mannosyl transferase
MAHTDHRTASLDSPAFFRDRMVHHSFHFRIIRSAPSSQSFRPPHIIFDETHFGGFVSDYLRGICFFDIHPPLGKLILYAAARFTGYDGSYNFSQFAAPYTTDFYIPLRATPAVFSSLIAPF